MSAKDLTNIGIKFLGFLSLKSNVGECTEAASSLSKDHFWSLESLYCHLALLEMLIMRMVSTNHIVHGYYTFSLSDWSRCLSLDWCLYFSSISNAAKGSTNDSELGTCCSTHSHQLIGAVNTLWDSGLVHCGLIRLMWSWWVLYFFATFLYISH